MLVFKVILEKSKATLAYTESLRSFISISAKDFSLTHLCRHTSFSIYLSLQSFANKIVVNNNTKFVFQLIYTFRITKAFTMKLIKACQF